MFGLSTILDSLDSAAKDTLDEHPAPSATWLRSQRKGGSSSTLREPDASNNRDLGVSHSDAYTQRGIINGPSLGVGDDHALSVLASEEVSATPFAKPNNSRGHNNIDGGSVKSHPAETRLAAAAAVSREAAQVLLTQQGQSQQRARSSGGAAHADTSTRDSDDEIERLNAECLDLEDQVNALRAEAHAAWAEYQKAQGHAAAREEEHRQELGAAAKQVACDKTALKDAQKALQEAQDMLSAGGSDAADEEMRQQWQVRETQLLTEVATLRAGSAQGTDSLQSDLRAAVEGAERLRLEHATLVRQSQRRQADLEKANAELSAGMADAQKDLLLLQQQSAAAIGVSSATAAQEELEAAREYWKNALAELAAERIRSETLGKCLQTAEANARAQEAVADDERTRAQVAASAHARAMTALQEQLGAFERAQSATTSSMNAISGAGVGTEEVRGLQGQVQNLSQQLLRKQQMVLDLQAERSTLKSRVQDLQAKAAIAERFMQEGGHGGGGGGGSAYDDDDAAAMESGRVGMQRRGRSTVRDEKKSDNEDNVSSAIERFGVKTPARVAKAVDALDSLTLDLGRVLRSYPLVRVGFVAYLCLLHVWVFVVLAMHTHSLEENIGKPAGVVNSMARGPQ